MMIGIGSDHAGYELKEKIKKYLNELDYQVIDYGTMVNTSVDYPDYAFKVGESIASKGIQLGILVCKTGIGMSIACNKVKGVRCAKVDNVEEAYLTRFHNNSNVLAISSMNPNALEIVKTFLETKFSNEERHVRRINKISEYEEKHEY
ncbi:MAG: ribose 5-phosphate isomerase B [Tenericutes bacterium]|nr:ribose 5-phosphate isomerase B [Mycoplasmatota bacterium]